MYSYTTKDPELDLMAKMAERPYHIEAAAQNTYEIMGISVLPSDRLHSPDIDLILPAPHEWMVVWDPRSNGNDSHLISHTNGTQLSEIATSSYDLSNKSAPSPITDFPDDPNSMLFHELLRQLVLAGRAKKRIGSKFFSEAEIYRSIASRKPLRFHRNWCGVHVTNKRRWAPYIFQCYDECIYLSGCNGNIGGSGPVPFDHQVRVDPG